MNFENSEEVFMCQCSEPAHQFVVRLYNDEDIDYRFLNVCVCLSGYSWWRRIYIAILYVLGLDTRNGPFDDVLIRDEDVPRLRDLLNRYIELKSLKELTDKF